jgi:hypothetical protein
LLFTISKMFQLRKTLAYTLLLFILCFYYLIFLISIVDEVNSQDVPKCNAGLCNTKCNKFSTINFDYFGSQCLDTNCQCEFIQYLPPSSCNLQGGASLCPDDSIINCQGLDLINSSSTCFQGRRPYCSCFGFAKSN